MNQLCKVCGDPAAGFHFGAFTCEGCKSFFGRTYNNLSSVSECKNSGRCVITKKNRTSCKACRLRKCILVGMSKSGSRYGRRSNWFKIHCLLQEQQQAAQGDWGTGQTPDMPLGSTSLSMTPGSAPSPPSPSAPQKEGREDYPFKGMSLSPLLPHNKEDRSPTAGATPVPPPPGSMPYDRNMLFSPLAPFMPSQQAALLNPAANPALLLARYRQNILLDALWSSAAGGLPPPPMPPMGQAVPHPPSMPSIGLPAPEQDTPIDLSVKQGPGETTGSKGWNSMNHNNNNNNNKLHQPPSPSSMMLNSAAAAKHLFGMGNPAAAAAALAGLNPFDLARHHQFPGMPHPHNNHHHSHHHHHQLHHNNNLHNHHHHHHPHMPPAALNLNLVVGGGDSSNKGDVKSESEDQTSDAESASPRHLNHSNSTVGSGGSRRNSAGFTMRPSSRSPGSPGSAGSSSDDERSSNKKRRLMDEDEDSAPERDMVAEDDDDDQEEEEEEEDDERDERNLDSDSDAFSSSHERVNPQPLLPTFHSAPLDLSAPNQIST